MVNPNLLLDIMRRRLGHASQVGAAEKAVSPSAEPSDAEGEGSEAPPTLPDEVAAPNANHSRVGLGFVTLGALIAAVVLAGCGGGTTLPPTGTVLPTPTQSPNSSFRPSSDATSPPTSDPTSACATTAGVTECVSGLTYFTDRDQTGNTAYLVEFRYSVNNQSGQSISDVGGGMAVVGSGSQTIYDIRSGADNGDSRVPLDLLTGNACFDSLDSTVTVLNGQRYTLPAPFCFLLPSSSDRVQAVEDQESGATITIAG